MVIRAGFALTRGSSTYWVLAVLAFGGCSRGGQEAGAEAGRETPASVATGAALAADREGPGSREAGIPRVGEAGAALPGALEIGGVLPRLAAVAGHAPRTECGIGALMPWADRLWLVSYVAHTASSGTGTGLYEVDETLSMRKRPESVVGTYANRMIHSESSQLFIGPHAIDPAGNVRTLDALEKHRLTATVRHLSDPKSKVYFLTMEGLLFEVDVQTLGATQVADVKEALEIAGPAHFKAAHTGLGRLVVANNSYDEKDFERPGSGDGRLAEWDGDKWTILERTAFVEVVGNGIQENAIFATGWDRASAILKVFTGGRWSTYRLPKGTQSQDQAWFTEWPRIREVETERLLMDLHGVFYELPALAYEGKVWGIRPISSHLRMVPDFCSWRGLLVLAGNENSSMKDKNIVGGQPQSGLWLGKTDDLWSFGKPAGWGGPWWESMTGKPSDPYLMTGFDKKVLHLSHDSTYEVCFTVEVDFLGNQEWKTYAVIAVPARGYAHHEFPDGFSAHWVRVTASPQCRATAYFVYS
jgi:hypothetical protein